MTSFAMGFSFGRATPYVLYLMTKAEPYLPTRTVSGELVQSYASSLTSLLLRLDGGLSAYYDPALFWVPQRALILDVQPCATRTSYPSSLFPRSKRLAGGTCELLRDFRYHTLFRKKANRLLTHVPFFRHERSTSRQRRLSPTFSKTTVPNYRSGFSSTPLNETPTSKLSGMPPISIRQSL